MSKHVKFELFFRPQRKSIIIFVVKCKMYNRCLAHYPKTEIQESKTEQQNNNHNNNNNKILEFIRKRDDNTNLKLEGRVLICMTH